MNQFLGLIGAIAMPLWNIPLIIKVSRRRSSKDLSVSWAVGVLACLILMLPSALASSELVFKVFALMNLILFSVVVIQVVRYR